MRGLRVFIGGVGTGVGKTAITRGLARALRARGCDVVALKPIETGVVDGHAEDALALADACGCSGVANDPAFLRAEAPLTPLVAWNTPVALDRLAHAVARYADGAECTLIEAAGGLFSPITESATNLEFAAVTRADCLLVVARNALGVLSASIAVTRAARASGRDVDAFVLVDEASASADASRATNADVLRQCTGLPVFRFAWTDGGTDSLAAAAENARDADGRALIDTLLAIRTPTAR